MPARAAAQELEPGAYWPLPVGLNIVTAVNSLNWGDLTFDPALPVENASARINTTAAAFTRALSIAGRSANAGSRSRSSAGTSKGCISDSPPRSGGSGSAIRGSGWR